MKGIMGALGLAAVLAAPCSAQDDAALLKAIAGSKHSLADGVRQLTRGDEVAISAKFEFDDNGKISLSIYTAEKGLGVDAERNVLKEFAGSPEGADWKPEAEVFKDVKHVSRSSQQLTLMALSKKSLLDVVAKAEKEKQGQVISIAPTIVKGKPCFAVKAAVQGKIVEAKYDFDD